MRALLSMGLKPGGQVREPLRAVLRDCDLATGEVVRELSWRADSPAGPREHCELTAPSWSGDLLVQPTRSEVLWVCPSRWEVVRRFGHPLLYDVHHAVERAGQLWVACTGHESVVVFEGDTVVRRWWLRDGRFEDAYPGVTDFRTVPADRFKPHTHHPNHVFFVDGEPWVTVLEARAAVCLTRPERRIDIPEGPPHDGVIRDGLLWFTAVTGHVIAVDPVSLRRQVHLDVGALSGARGMVGWCRGVEVVGRTLFVGMTALRGSRWRELARRVARGPAGNKLPTRILVIDLDTGTVVDVVEVGNAAGGTLYGISALPEANRGPSTATSRPG